MEFLVFLALLVAIPVILAPVALVWYINIGGLWTMWKETRARDKKKALRTA